MIITIDGPSGAGKSTVSRLLAKRIGFTYVDTGALYRALALVLEEAGIDLEDEAALKERCSAVRFQVEADGDLFRVLHDGEDLTEKIRRPEVARIASLISSKRAVREALFGLQRALSRRGRVIFEGRDMGTVVFPDAEVKFYLDASVEERGRRRYAELVQKGQQTSLEEVIEGIKKRDHDDSTRELAPLRVPEDAFVIDSTNMTVEEVVEEMLQILESRT